MEESDESHASLEKEILALHRKYVESPQAPDVIAASLCQEKAGVEGNVLKTSSSEVLLALPGHLARPSCRLESIVYDWSLSDDHLSLEDLANTLGPAIAMNTTLKEVDVAFGKISRRINAGGLMLSLVSSIPKQMTRFVIRSVDICSCSDLEKGAWCWSALGNVLARTSLVEVGLVGFWDPYMPRGEVTSAFAHLINNSKTIKKLDISRSILFAEDYVLLFSKTNLAEKLAVNGGGLCIDVSMIGLTGIPASFRKVCADIMRQLKPTAELRDLGLFVEDICPAIVETISSKIWGTRRLGVMVNSAGGHDLSYNALDGILSSPEACEKLIETCAEHSKRIFQDVDELLRSVDSEWKSDGMLGLVDVWALCLMYVCEFHLEEASWRDLVRKVYSFAVGHFKRSSVLSQSFYASLCLFLIEWKWCILDGRNPFESEHVARSLNMMARCPLSISEDEEIVLISLSYHSTIKLTGGDFKSREPQLWLEMLAYVSPCVVNEESPDALNVEDIGEMKDRPFELLSSKGVLALASLPAIVICRSLAHLMKDVLKSNLSFTKSAIAESVLACGGFLLRYFFILSYMRKAGESIDDFLVTPEDLGHDPTNIEVNELLDWLASWAYSMLSISQGLPDIKKSYVLMMFLAGSKPDGGLPYLMEHEGLQSFNELVSQAEESVDLYFEREDFPRLIKEQSCEKFPIMSTLLLLKKIREAEKDMSHSQASSLFYLIEFGFAKTMEDLYFVKTMYFDSWINMAMEFYSSDIVDRFPYFRKLKCYNAIDMMEEDPSKDPISHFNLNLVPEISKLLAKHLPAVGDAVHHTVVNILKCREAWESSYAQRLLLSRSTYFSHLHDRNIRAHGEMRAGRYKSYRSDNGGHIRDMRTARDDLMKLGKSIDMPTSIKGIFTYLAKYGNRDEGTRTMTEVGAAICHGDPGVSVSAIEKYGRTPLEYVHSYLAYECISRLSRNSFDLC